MKKADLILTDLKRGGHKNTKIRQAIVELLVSSTSPVSVVEILGRLSDKKLSPNKTTVYREIEFLKAQNVLQEVEFGDGKKRYEISEEHHHHIICVNCRSIKDVPMEKHLSEEEKRVIKKLGYRPVGHSLEFFGICKNCQ